MSEKCKICGKELKKINAGHLSTHKITVSEYRKQYEDAVELPEDEIIEVKKSAEIKPTEITENIFKKETEPDVELLMDFLEKHELTEMEVINLIVNYKDGKRLPTNMTIKKHKTEASEEIKQHLDKEHAEVHSVFEAEELEKHGFSTIDVRRGPPKTWVLHKQ